MLEAKFDRVILTGCTLPRDYDWAKWKTKERIDVVLNLICGRDLPVRFAFLIPGGGDSGRRGFSRVCGSLLQRRYPAHGHSDLLRVQRFRSVFVPFLVNEQLPAEKDAVDL